MNISWKVKIASCEINYVNNCIMLFRTCYSLLLYAVLIPSKWFLLLNIKKKLCNNVIIIYIFNEKWYVKYILSNSFLENCILHKYVKFILRESAIS